MKMYLILLIVILLSGCVPPSSLQTQPAGFPPTTTVGPGAVKLLATPKPLPTASDLNYELKYRGLVLKMLSAEQNASYTTEYGTTREAPEGFNFLWVQLSLESADNKGTEIPNWDHFSVLYGGVEFKPTYGHREGSPDYTSLTGTLLPGKSRQAWLRFDLPADARLEDMQFAFLPESTQAVPARSGEEASYYDHPVFLWKLSEK